MIWPTVKLVEVADIERSGVNPSAIATGTEYLGLEHIESGGNIISRQVVANGELASAKFAFSSDHLLYGKLRPYLAKIALPEFEGVCSTDILPIKPGPKLDRKFLAYFLRQPSMVDYASSLSTGANLPRLSPRALAEFEIPLPPLGEQRRIAAILDHADALRRARHRTIERLNELGRATFHEMFGDPISNPKQWPVTELGHVGQLDRGVSKHRPRNDPSLLGGNHPFIQTGDVANCDTYIRRYTSTYSDLGLAQSKLWQPGVLCITIAANIAKTGILTFPACFPDSVVGFIPGDSVTTEYVQVWLSFLQKTIERKAPESAQKNINLAILRSLPIPVPDLELQDSFAAFSGRIEAQRTALKCASERTECLFTSLEHRAFRGEL